MENIVITTVVYMRIPMVVCDYSANNNNDNNDMYLKT